MGRGKFLNRSGFRVKEKGVSIDDLGGDGQERRQAREYARGAFL